MLEEETLAALLADLVTRHGDTSALIERSGTAVRTTTFRQLAASSSRVAAQLKVHDAQRGDVIGVWLPNWTETVVLEFAAASIGVAVLGINTRYGVHELGHLLRVGSLVGVVVPNRFHGLDFAGRLLQAASAAASDEPGLRLPWIATVDNSWRQEAETRPATDLDVGGGWWQLDADSGSAEKSFDVGQPRDVVNYFTTSGSTGLPKIAGHDQASVVKHARHVAAALGMRHGDVQLCALPLSGVFGFNPMMGMLFAGGTCLLEPVFDASLVLRDMDAFAVSHVVGGDDLLGRLMDAWAEEPRPLTAFRRGGIADFAGRAEAVVSWAEESFGAEVSGVYGSSELFSLTSIWPSGRSVLDRVRGGGRVVAPEIRVRVADEDGRPMPTGETGELQFRGYNVLGRYLGPSDTSSFTRDGWFRSGDLGYLTEVMGEFVYVCRAGDALRLRGFLVEPAEIERFLMVQPAIEMARVVGVPDKSGHVRAVAYVTSIAGLSVDVAQVMATCRAQLAPFKVPSLLRVIDEFPITTGTNGTKIRTSELRRWAEQDLRASQDQGGTHNASA